MVTVFLESQPTSKAFDEKAKSIKMAIRRGLKKAGDYQASRVRETFLKQGERDGNPRWPKTAFLSLLCRRSFPKGMGKQARERYRQHAPTLIDTGRLMNSFRPSGVAMGDSFIENTVKSTVDYGQKLHFGGTVTIACHPKNKTPKQVILKPRPFMYISTSDEDRITAFIEQELSSG